MTALYHAYSQTVADGTATSVVRPSDWNSAHVQNQTISGNTLGVSSFSGTNIVFQGGNNVTLSAATAAGAATIVISGANTVAQTVQTQASGAIAGTGFTSTTTAGTNITAALGTNGLTMAVPAFITTATQSTQTQPAGNIAGAGYTSTTQAGSTVGITQNSNGLSAAWPPYITTATQSTQTQASGAIAGTGFTSTTTAGTAVTAALGTNGLSMAVPAFITTYAAQTQQPMYFSASGTSTSANTIQFGNSNGVSFSLSNGSVVGTVGTNYAGLNETTAATNAAVSLSLDTNGVALSINVTHDDIAAWNLLGNTSGTTGSTLTTQGALYLQGGNNITLSGNSNTIVISAGAAGGGFTASGYNHYNDVVQVAGQVGQGTLNFDPVNLDFPVQFDRFGIPIAYTATSNSTGSQTISLRIGIYTNNAGTLSLLQSASTAVTAANSGTAGSYSLFSGFRLVTIPFTTTLQPNDYWMGVVSSTSSSSQNGASVSAMLQSNLGSNFVGFFGASNNTTQQYTLGQGVFSVTTNAMPGSVAFSQIRGSDSNAARPPIVGWYSGTV